VFGAFSAESGNDGNDLNENRPSHGGESWGRHSMRIGGDGACINSRSCFPFLRGPASARYRFKLYPRRDCAVSFAVILPIGIAVEHANSAPVVPGGAFSCRDAMRELLVNLGFGVPKCKRPWNEDDVAKLRAIAGKEQGKRIAAVLR
jgi:hypothetical protein